MCTITQSVLENEVSRRSFPSKEEITYHKYDFNSNNPAVYCGTYGKYNNGSLEGMWIDLTTFDDYDEFIEFCCNLHADEDDFDTIIEYANHDDRDAVDAFLCCYNIDELDKFDDAYVGKFDSEEDFARHIVDECYDIEKTMGNLSYYFDYDAYARDLFMCDFFFDNGYVFRR